VISIKAEPPDITAGQTTTLTALAFDPMGRPLTMSWAACTLPVDSSGANVNPACITTASGDGIVPIGAGASVQFTMPRLPIDLPNLFKSGALDQTDGYYLPIRVVVTAGDNTVTAIYRLRYTLFPPANKNPKLIDLVQSPDGDAGTPAISIPEGLSWDKGLPLVMRAVPSADSIEKYTIITLDANNQPLPETVSEELRISWFSTAGKFDNEHTGTDKPDTTITFDPAMAAGPVDLWVVVNDGRGGDDTLHRTLNLH
jgi:hypothetical protein